MRPKSMILIVIALGCGLVASIGISQVIDKRNQQAGPNKGETVKIFVAMVDVPIGEPLTAELVRLEEWPKDRVPEGSISLLEEIINRRPRTLLFAGEPIMEPKLISGNGLEGASERIPEGYRVSSVKVDLPASVSGLVLPGDRVDVVCYFRRSTDVPQPIVKTILEQVTVFAVNEQTTREADRDVTVIHAKTVSLVLRPVDDNRLMLAGQLGHLQLSLRRAGDDSTDSSGDITVEDLLGDDTVDASFRADGGEEEGNRSLVDLLAQQQRERESQSNNTGLDFTMVILTPEGSSQFVWEQGETHPPTLMGASGNRSLGSDEHPALPGAEEIDLEELEIDSDNFDFDFGEG